MPTYERYHSCFVVEANDSLYYVPVITGERTKPSQLGNDNNIILGRLIGERAALRVYTLLSHTPFAMNYIN